MERPLALLLHAAAVLFAACAATPSPRPFSDDVLADHGEPPARLSRGTPISDPEPIAVAVVVASRWLDGYALAGRAGSIRGFCFRIEDADPPQEFLDALANHPAGSVEGGSRCTFFPGRFETSTGAEAARLLIRDVKVDGNQASLESMSGMILSGREFCGCQVLWLLEKDDRGWHVTDEIGGVCY